MFSETNFVLISAEFRSNVLLVDLNMVFRNCALAKKRARN